MLHRDLENELLSVSQIAQVLNVPVSWIYERSRRRGADRIPNVKLGKYLRFDPKEVRKWLSELRNY